jgi:hypothetical protein
LPRAILERVEWRARYGHIDFDRSAAWSEELDYAPSIRILGEGREHRRRTERVVEALEAWEDSVDGRRIVGRVHRRSELHRGLWSRRAPDLVPEFARPGGFAYVVLPSRADGPVQSRSLGLDRRGAKGRGMTGSHRRDGVWIATGAGLAGEGVRRGIADLLPAALGDLAGASVPPPSIAEGAQSAALLRRLRSLGYVQ